MGCSNLCKNIHNRQGTTHLQIPYFDTQHGSINLHTRQGAHFGHVHCGQKVILSATHMNKTIICRSFVDHFKSLKNPVVFSSTLKAIFPTSRMVVCLPAMTSLAWQVQIPPQCGGAWLCHVCLWGCRQASGAVNGVVMTGNKKNILWDYMGN